MVREALCECGWRGDAQTDETLAGADLFRHLERAHAAEGYYNTPLPHVWLVSPGETRRASVPYRTD